MSLRYFFAAIAAAASLAFGAAHATSVRAVDIDDLVASSAVVFEGTCVDNRVERDAQTNLVVTYTTFAVQDVLKGTAGDRYTIKQVGGELGDGKPSFKIQGVPRFVEGREYVVFVPPESNLGFASPVGLTQGRFHVERGGNGKGRASNGRDFRDLTARVPGNGRADDPVARLRASAKAEKDLDLDEFKDIVRRRARGQP